MATSNKEFESYYKAGYHKLYDVVDKRKGKVSNEAYAALVSAANEYREWAMDLAGLDSLPEVPTENK